MNLNDNDIPLLAANDARNKIAWAFGAESMHWKVPVLAVALARTVQDPAEAGSWFFAGFLQALLPGLGQGKLGERSTFGMTVNEGVPRHPDSPFLPIVSCQINDSMIFFLLHAGRMSR